MRRPSKKLLILPQRQISVMEKASEFRRIVSNSDEPCDVARLLEEVLPERIPSFDWYLGDNDYFRSMPQVEAYVDFKDGKKMYVREHIYDSLFMGKGLELAKAMFVIAHEIGHALLHSKTKLSLARNKVGSRNQYLHNPKLEKEANIFAGSLTVPTTELDTGYSSFAIANQYNVSETTAKIAMEEATFYTQMQSYGKTKTKLVERMEMDR